MTTPTLKALLREHLLDEIAIWAATRHRQTDTGPHTTALPQGASRGATGEGGK